MGNYIELHVIGRPILLSCQAIIYVSKDFSTERACILMKYDHNLRVDESFDDVKKILAEREVRK